MKTHIQLILISILFSNLTCLSQSDKLQVSITDLRQKVDLIGELGKPLGTLTTVEGIVVLGSYQSTKSYLNLLVQKIEDSVTQDYILIPIKPFWPSWEDFDDDFEPNIKIGETYRLRVYETGAYVGVPLDAYKERNISFPTIIGHSLRTELRVLSGIKIQTIDYHPSDFIERKGLFTGKATKRNNISYIFGNGWKIELSKDFKWDSTELNKEVEIYGKVTSANEKEIFQLIEGSPRLTKLKDQLGKTVKIRGMAWSMNGYWWFNYRGIDVYIEGMENLPNWSVDNHGEYMEISGLLRKKTKSDFDQTTLRNNPDFEKINYVIENASWKLINGLLAPEMIEGLFNRYD